MIRNHPSVGASGTKCLMRLEWRYLQSHQRLDYYTRICFQVYHMVGGRIQFFPRNWPVAFLSLSSGLLHRAAPRGAAGFTQNKWSKISGKIVPQTKDTVILKTQKWHLISSATFIRNDLLNLAYVYKNANTRRWGLLGTFERLLTISGLSVYIFFSWNLSYLLVCLLTIIFYFLFSNLSFGYLIEILSSFISMNMKI